MRLLPIVSPIAILLASFSFFIGCSKSSDGPVTPPDPKKDTAYYLPVKIIKDGKVIDSFAYNPDNTVREIFQDKNDHGTWGNRTIFTYNAQRQCIGTLTNEADTATQKSEIRYNSSQVTIYSSYSIKEEQPHFDSTFLTLSLSGQLSAIRKDSLYTAIGYSVHVREFEYKNENLDKFLFTSYYGSFSNNSRTVVARKRTFEYDNKPNSFSKLLEINPFLHIWFGLWNRQEFVSIGKNNVLNYKIAETINEQPLNSADYKGTITYDSQTGMLISQVFLNIVNNGTSVIEYTFKKI